MNNRLAPIFFTALSFAVVLLTGDTPIIRSYENRSIDSRFYWRHRLLGPSPSHEIRIIGIDDPTLEALGGRWPIPIEWHALLLEALTERLPAVVAYDILFQSIGKEEMRGERVLVQATRMLGDLLYPYFFSFEKEPAAALSIYKSPAQRERERALLEKYRIDTVEGDISSIPVATEATLPLLPLAESAALGFSNSPGDAADGVVRRVPLILRFNGNLYPSFSLMAALRYYNVRSQAVRIEAGRRISFVTPEGVPRSIPIDSRGRMLINYTARHNEFPNSLFVQVVQSFAMEKKKGEEGAGGPVDLADFEGKIVLVGLTASGVIESYTKPTPLSPESPLLTVHANALSTIISGAFPRALGRAAAAGFLLLLGSVVAFVTARSKAAASLLLAVLCLSFYAFSAYALFLSQGLILPLVPGFLMVALVYTLITSYRYATEERQRKFLRGVLGRYLSKNVMEAILEDPRSLRPGGDRKELTVLFADVKGFSGFCEKSPVEMIAPRLNELHDRLTHAIWKYDGTLDKYIGDGLMAFWGAPLDQPDHARRAVLAGLKMREEVERMRREREARGEESFSVGIGINTGSMIVGNMGASEFWDYTVLGDEVNIASRLEQLTRSYDVDLMVSDSTCRLVKDVVEARRLGEVKVKGREKPIVIFAIIGRRSDFKGAKR